MVSYPQSTAVDRPTGREARHGGPGGASVVTIDGLVLLAGLFTAITPWVINDFSVAPKLVIQNLILGLAVAVIGLVITAMPTHGYGLSWVLIPIGVWQIISPWVVGERPTGVLWTNVVMGAIVTVLGLAAAGLLVTTAVSDRRPHAAAAHH